MSIRSCWCSELTQPQHSAVTSLNDPSAKWRELVGYLKRCITLEAADGLVDMADQRWVAMKLQSEDLISGSGSSLEFSADLKTISTNLKSGEVLQYGWPTVVVLDKSGIRRLAPLLVTELEAPQLGTRGSLPSTTHT